jgi:hypothetical protein
MCASSIVTAISTLDTMRYAFDCAGLPFDPNDDTRPIRWQNTRNRVRIWVDDELIYDGMPIRRFVTVTNQEDGNVSR